MLDWRPSSTINEGSRNPGHPRRKALDARQPSRVLSTLCKNGHGSELRACQVQQKA